MEVGDIVGIYRITGPSQRTEEPVKCGRGRWRYPEVYPVECTVCGAQRNIRTFKTVATQCLHAEGIIQRIQGAAVVDPETGCWTVPTTGTSKGNRYHTVRYKGRGRLAHRLMYCLLHGLDYGHPLVMRHTCDNSRCVNPDHLLIGTHSQNTQDKFIRGRAKESSLTPDKVNAIRTSIASGARTKDIAVEHGVSTKVVYDIRTGARWAWLPPT